MYAPMQVRTAPSSVAIRRAKRFDTFGAEGDVEGDVEVEDDEKGDVGTKAVTNIVVVSSPALRRLVRAAEERGCKELEPSRAMAIFDELMQVLVVMISSGVSSGGDGGGDGSGGSKMTLYSARAATAKSQTMPPRRIGTVSPSRSSAPRFTASAKHIGRSRNLRLPLMSC